MLFFNLTPAIEKSTIRENINRLMESDRPGRGIFGFLNYSRGLHFKRNDEIISGIYLMENEGESIHSPMKTYFRGRLLQQGENLIFKGFIIPYPLEAIFIIAIPWLTTVWIAMLIYLVFGCFYFKLITENYKDLKRFLGIYQ